MCQRTEKHWWTLNTPTLLGWKCSNCCHRWFERVVKEPSTVRQAEETISQQRRQQLLAATVVMGSDNTDTVSPVHHQPPMWLTRIHTLTWVNTTSCHDARVWPPWSTVVTAMHSGNYWQTLPSVKKPLWWGGETGQNSRLLLTCFRENVLDHRGPPQIQYVSLRNTGTPHQHTHTYMLRESNIYSKFQMSEKMIHTHLQHYFFPGRWTGFMWPEIFCICS